MEHRMKGNGFSLVGLLMGVGILSVVVLGSGYLLSSAKTTEVRSDLQAEMDRSHLLAVQQTRSIAYLKQQLHLNADQNKNAGNSPQDTMLMNCLAKRGSQCRSYGVGNDSQFSQPVASVDTRCGVGTACMVRSTISYRGICTDKSCSSIDVKFSSQYMGDKYSMKPRENIVRIAASLFADKGNVSFNCTNQRALASINTEELEAVCQTPDPSACGANAPLQGYKVCPALATQTCGIGVRAVGLYNGQGTCRN